VATRAAGRPVGTSDTNRYEEVLEAAITAFDRNGYKSTSVQDIADEAGIVKGTLYHYIKAKEDLLFEIINRVQQQMVPKLAELEALETSAADKLRTFICWYVEHTIANRRVFGIFLRDFDALSPKRRKQLTEVRDSYDGFVMSLIAAGQQAGEFRDDVTPRVFAFSIFGMIHWIYQWYSPSGSLTTDDVGRQMADLALVGIVAPAG
jgi:AcrR family transcriptional regulator